MKTTVAVPHVTPEVSMAVGMLCLVGGVLALCTCTEQGRCWSRWDKPLPGARAGASDRMHWQALFPGCAVRPQYGVLLDGLTDVQPGDTLEIYRGVWLDNCQGTMSLDGGETAAVVQCNAGDFRGKASFNAFHRRGEVIIEQIVSTSLSVSD